MENGQSFNNPPAPAEDRQNVAERDRKRQRQGRMARIMRREQQFRSRTERDSRVAMMMSLARRAVRRAISYNPNTIVGRWRRDRLLQKWKQDSSELASLNRPGSGF
jgi:hypothetical protein